MHEEDHQMKVRGKCAIKEHDINLLKEGYEKNRRVNRKG